VILNKIINTFSILDCIGRIVSVLIRKNIISMINKSNVLDRLININLHKDYVYK
jgi:hypothetical protein